MLHISSSQFSEPRLPTSGMNKVLSCCLPTATDHFRRHGTGQFTTRTVVCACASSLAALCSVHVLHAQHKWASELSSSPLFPASSGNSASKVQVTSAVRQAASFLGMPLGTLTGARRHSRRTFRTTGAVYFASCRSPCVEDPGRMAVRVAQDVLEVRAALTVGSSLVSLEASLGGDLQAMQKQLLAVKGRVSASAGSTLAS